MRTFSPGGVPQQRESFRVRRAGGGQEPRKRGIRRQAPIVKMNREMAIGIVVLGVLLALVLAGGLWLIGLGRDKLVAVESGREDETSAEARIVWQGPIPSEIADRFTTATTHAERLKWVRQPEVVGPMMESFFRDGPGASEKVVETRPINTSGGGALLYENFQIVLAEGEPRLLCVSVDPAGAKVDFKAYARYGSEKWSDLLSGKVATAEEMRVILTPGGFYMHRFPDETRWLNFKASTLDLPESMDFYVERDSEAGRQLIGIEAAAQAIVSLRAVEDSAKHRQFEITALKAFGWVAHEE